MKSKLIFSISALAFIILLFIVPRGFIPTDLGNTILTITTFLFGILAGFYIVVTTTDYNSMKERLAEESAGWIALYRAMGAYGSEYKEKIAQLIDMYVRRSFDKELIDYTRVTQNEFKEIEHYIDTIAIREEKAGIYEKIIEIMADISSARQKIAVLGTKTLSFFQWAVLFVLGFVIIMSLYGLRTGELFFELVAVLVSVSIILIFLLIRELDLYIWNEKTFGYEIFQNVFRSIDRLPYYPLESIQKNRIRPLEKEYRIGVYTNYPVSSQRKIEIHKNS